MDAPSAPTIDPATVTKQQNNNMLTVAYLLHNSAGAPIATDRNEKQFTAYQEAHANANIKLKAFLMDFMYLTATPFMSPILVACLEILVFTILALYYGNISIHDACKCIHILCFYFFSSGFYVLLILRICILIDPIVSLFLL